MDFITKDIIWNNLSLKKLVNYLKSIEDINYKEFNQKLISTKYKIIGVRVPLLRKIAKIIIKTNYRDFLKLKSNIYEIVFLQGLVISLINEYNEVKIEIRDFLYKIDNWAICDMMASSLKIINKEKEDFINEIDYYISNEGLFSKRLGYVILLNYYIEKQYLNMIFDYIVNEETDEYYINMAISWLLCEMYIKHDKIVYKFLTVNKINKIIINMTIRKIQDSYRITKENKLKAKMLKQKL